MSVTHLNQVELAARLKISPRTLERWRWTGEGPAFLKIGGRVIYRLDDVEAYENGRRCESTVQSVQLRAAQ
jgi:predicted site-specific integrase-resolvase